MNYYANPYFPILYTENQLDNNFTTLYMDESFKNNQIL